MIILYIDVKCFRCLDQKGNDYIVMIIHTMTVVMENASIVETVLLFVMIL